MPAGGSNDPEVCFTTAMENVLESAHLLLGESFARLGDPRAAERHLLRALELNPRSKVALEELAAIYRGAGRLAESRLLLERAAAAGVSP